MQGITDIGRQYRGFLNTPTLWKEGEMMGMRQFIPIRRSHNTYDGEVSKHLRLGNLVEEFTFYELSQDNDIELLATNLQIKSKGITKGELDCLLKHKEQYIHLEIVFKYYLYDDSVVGSEWSKWVGPNKNDSLIRKLNKLNNKQLPLLYEDRTVEYLKELSLMPSQFSQRVYFKAQLFLPLILKELNAAKINNECVKGFYLKMSELKSVSSHRFYIPFKRDWLCDPHIEVEWMTYEEFAAELLILLNQKRSPLCWLNSDVDQFEKFFVVWW